jgi:preprotein translocase subunit SecE
MFEKITNYLKGVRSEVDRVSWPARNEVISLTVLILLLVVVLTVYIWGVDTVIQAVIRFFVQL